MKTIQSMKTIRELMIAFGNYLLKDKPTPVIENETHAESFPLHNKLQGCPHCGAMYYAGRYVFTPNRYHIGRNTSAIQCAVCLQIYKARIYFD